MDPPQDKGQVAYWSVFLLGAGVLAPWNSFITAVDYFEAVYPGSHMDRKFSVLYMPAMLVTLSIMVVWNKLFSLTARVRVGLSAFTVILILVPIIDAIFVHGVKASPAAQIITLAGLFLVGVFDGVCQGAVIAESAYLPGLYQQAYTSGTAASGLLISFLRIATKLALPDTTKGLRVSTTIYFLTSAMICFACLMIHSKILPTLPFVKFYKEKADRADQDQKGISFTENDGDNGIEADDVGLVSKSRKGRDYVQVTRKMLHPVIALMMMYLVTLTIFPGVPAEDVHSKVLGDWYGILLITIYNIADFVGKYMPAYTPAIQKGWVLTMATASRLLFLPIFLLAMKFSPIPVLLFFLVFALGLTNGYLTTNAFMMGSASLSGNEYDIGGNIMVLALVIGLVMGAFGGWAILAFE
ncbi:hypothetical protein BSKO_10023 [Bryopsis sp. KO-2023]|nr:hypothetical protein BSKO_10023 [Bryopsis sp. KO-2023]